YRGVLPGHSVLCSGERARRALERPAFCDQLAGQTGCDLGQGRPTARFRPGLAFGGLSGRGAMAVALSLSSGKKPLAARAKPPVTAENMMPINSLDTL